MTDRPWLKWYPSDWRADAGLRLCGLTARGLWIELLGYMHESSMPGHLLIGGKSPTIQQIASLVGADRTTVAKAVAELEANGVFSRTPDGTIYSRRMVADNGRIETGRESVARKWKTDEKPSEPATRSERLAAARKIARHTHEEWTALVEVCGPTCLRCGASFEASFPPMTPPMTPSMMPSRVKNHITPIYQNGSDGITNIQPLCRHCSDAKGPETKDFRSADWKERVEERLGKPLGDLGVNLGVKCLRNAYSYARSQSLEVSSPLTPIDLPEVKSREAARKPDEERNEPDVGRLNGVPASVPVANPPAVRRERKPDNPLSPFDLPGVKWRSDDGRPEVAGWYFDHAVKRVAEAARLDETGQKRGFFQPLVGWIAAGIEPDTIVAAVHRVASRAGYSPPFSLGFFDGAVREQRRQAA